MVMRNCYRPRRHTVTTLLTLTLLAAACAGKPTDPSAPPSPNIVQVAPPEYHGTAGHPLEKACRDWVLSPSQVQAFFHLADTYHDTPYSRFYQVGCSISGHLQAQGRNWRFAINGGGVATWQAGETIRHFGCSARECEALLLLPADGMEPD